MQIFVVITNIQMGILKTELETGSMLIAIWYFLKTVMFLLVVIPSMHIRVSPGGSLRENCAPLASPGAPVVPWGDQSDPSRTLGGCAFPGDRLDAIFKKFIPCKPDPPLSTLRGVLWTQRPILGKVP